MLIVGAALLISGIIISALWVGLFAGKFIRENTILRAVSIRSAASANASIQVTDTSRPISLAIRVERNNNTISSSQGGEAGGQIPNNTLRETVRNPNGFIMTSNEFTKQFFTTFKPDIPGRYTIYVYNLGTSTVNIGVLVGNLSSLSGIIAGVFLTIAGIIVLIAGVIIFILDRRRGRGSKMMSL